MNKMTDEPEMDPCYGDIMKFIDLFYYGKKLETYKYMIKLKDEWDTKEIFNGLTRHTLLRYNLYVYYFMIEYIKILIKKYYFSEEELKRILDYEPIFLELLRTILTNNYGNIRYDFTMSLIYENCDIILDYLDKSGLIYLLERINPEKIIYYTYCRDYSEREKLWKRAEYIYKIKIELRSTWMGTITKMF